MPPDQTAPQPPEDEQPPVRSAPRLIAAWATGLEAEYTKVAVALEGLAKDAGELYEAAREHLPYSFPAEARRLVYVAKHYAGLCRDAARTVPARMERELMDQIAEGSR